MSLRKSRGPRPAFTLVELLVVISVIGILIAMVLPAIEVVRESARRTHCMNNLRQLSMACLSYESTNDRFPHGCVFGQGAAWSAFILDEIEQTALSDRVDLTDKSSAPTGSGQAINWTNPPNESVCATFITTFRCPLDPVSDHIDSGPGPRMSQRVPSSYIGVASGTTKTQADLYWSGSKTKQFVREARSGVLLPSQHAAYFGAYRWKTKVSFNDILDGASNTLLLGETVFDTSTFDGVSKGIDHWYIGSYQIDYNQDVSEFLGSTAVPLNHYHRFNDEALSAMSNSQRASRFAEMAFGFGSWHADDGANFCFADGSTRYVTDEVEPVVYSHLGNRMDRQVIPSY